MEITIINKQRLIKISQQKIKKALKKTLQYLKDNGKLNPLLVTHYSSLELSIIFVNDKKMRELNLQYRGKDKTTDVLSFPQIASSVKRQASSVQRTTHDTRRTTHDALRSTLLGDIVINLSQAKRQAQENSKPKTQNSPLVFYEEVTRLVIHGLLHLLGYDHEKNKYQARKMREMEMELLRIGHF
jgi:probable rRNA maturation factor